MLKCSYLVGLFFLFLLASCSNANKGTIVTENGISLKFHDLSSTDISLFENCILNVNLLARDKKDKVVFSSKYQGLFGVSSFYYDSLLVNSPLHYVFEKTFTGDSLSFKVLRSTFYSSFFGSNDLLHNSSSREDDTLGITLRIVGFNSYEEQGSFTTSLIRKAIEEERVIVQDKQIEWKDKYVNIYENNGLYAIKLASSNIINNPEDSVSQFMALNYTLEDFSGRLVYTTNDKSEYYDLSLNNQLLGGFNILARKYERGDSIMAIIPSNLLFGKRGSFVNQIPPYCPLKVNLKIN